MTSPQIQAIRERYKSSLPEKAELIAEQIDLISSSKAGSLDECHGVLHKLAGSSGMYGYEDIALLCRSAMARVQDMDTIQLLNELTDLKDLLEKHVS